MANVMCIYCAKWFDPSAVKMKPLPDDLRQLYCPRCYPDVLQAWRQLPWNVKSPSLD